MVWSQWAYAVNVRKTTVSSSVESRVQVVLLCVSSDTSAFEFCHPLISWFL